MQGVVCYEIDGLCYYLTSGQSSILPMVPEDKRENRIKKWAYCTGKKGEPIPAPSGRGDKAVVMPTGEKVEESDAAVRTDPTIP